MKKNFTVNDAVAIQVGNDYCDLHNDFDLSLFEVDFAKKVLRLTFTRAVDFGTTSQSAAICIIFSEVDYLIVSTGVLSRMVREIIEIGYKSPDDFDLDWLMTESQAGLGDHLFFRLAGDDFIRVHSGFAWAQCDVVSRN